MPDPQLIQLPFGPGLDKETGAMVVKPNTMQDLRNVYHHEGSIVVRSGTEKTNEFFDGEVGWTQSGHSVGTGDAATHILAGVAIRSERAGIVVSWNSSAKRVAVWRVNALGGESVFIGFWPFLAQPDGSVTDVADFQWPAFDDEPPKIVLAEMYGQVFFAHDSRELFFRAATYVYNPWGLIEDTLRFGPLTADFLGELEVIRFRGVVRHLHYLFGWGWGTSAESRPELLRVSLPGEPTSFDPQHYFIAGDRRDPIIACEPARQTLLVCKETETYQVIGYSRANFGIRPYDQLYGCLASRLITSVSGTVYIWSAEGPMAGGDVGPFEKVWLPLDLGGFEPATLVARTDFSDGWADYIDEVELVIYCFGRRAYILSVRNPADPRWTYWELGKKAFCGFRLYGGDGIGGPPTSAPTGLSFTYEVEGCGTQARYITTMDNNAPADSDLVQVWHQPSGPFWEDSILLDELFIDTSGDGIPDGWTHDFVAVGGGSHTAFWNGASQFYFLSLFNGASATLVAGDYNELYWTTPAVTNGVQYRFEVDLQTPGVDENTFTQGPVWIEMQFYDSGDNPVGGANSRVVRHPNFARAFTEGVAPATATYARVAVHVHCRSTGRGGSARFRNPAFRVQDTAAGQWVVASDLVLAGPQATITLPPIGVSESGMDYNVAVRYVNIGLQPSPGYESSDPGTWPSASRGVAQVPMDAPDWFGFFGAPPDLAAGQYTERDDVGPFFQMLPGCDGSGGTGTAWLKYSNRDLEVYENGSFIGYMHQGDTTWYRRLQDSDLNLTYQYKMRYLGPDRDSPFGSVLTLKAGVAAGVPVISSLNFASYWGYVIGIDRSVDQYDSDGDGTLDAQTGVIIQDNYNNRGGNLPADEWNTRWVSKMYPPPGGGAPTVGMVFPGQGTIGLNKKVRGVTVKVRVLEFFEEFPSYLSDPEGTFVPVKVGNYSEIREIAWP